MEKITDRLWRKAGLNNIPLTGAFELLPACNLNCKMCYVRLDMSEVNRQGGLLSAEEWLDFAVQARDEGMLFPLLTGGEPLLHKDFYEIYTGMQQMGLQVSMNTNGVLINESVAKWLGQHIPVRINITLYGASEDTYENLCGDGAAYEKVIRAVELLKKYRVPIKFNTSITNENVNDLEKIIQYAKSVDTPIQVATYMFPPVRKNADMIGKNHRLSPEEAARARVVADFLQSDSDWFLGQAARFKKFVPLTEKMLEKQKSNEARGMTCRAGRCSFWIDWRGELGNCGMYTTHRISLKEQNFKNAWKEIVEETENVRFSPFCTNCPNIHLCHACIAMVHNECGNVNGRPEYLCEMNHAAARLYQEYVKRIM